MGITIIKENNCDFVDRQGCFVRNGVVIKKSYDEIIEKIDKTGVYSKDVQKPKTADQITSDVIAKGGLRLIDNTRKEEKE